jgi:ATP-dependent helicase/nuclease subunit B
MAGILSDLREWLRRASGDDSGFVPRHFELAFGLKLQNASRAADPRSVEGAVDLIGGLQLRGSIDLVEANPSGQLRVTDHKSGKPDGKAGQVIAGGTTLQPLLYALAAEKLFAGEAVVESGRLYFCTAAGGYSVVEVPLEHDPFRPKRNPH